MLSKSLAAIAALSLAATPAAAASSAGTSGASALSLQPPAYAEGRAVGNPFTAPGATVGLALFATVIILGILLGTGTLFDDDDGPVSA